MVYHAGMDGRGPIVEQQGVQGARYLFIEPYLNGSHRALAQALMQGVPGEWTLLGLPGRFFRWRMRGSAAFFAETAGGILREPWDALLCSSMLNLAELRGLLPELAQVPALVYFHENQLAYPAVGEADKKQQERDLYLAFSNLTSAATAKLAVFNSAYHRDEVVEAAKELLNRLPDAVPMGLVQGLIDKSRVLPVPLMVEESHGLEREPRQGPLRLVWNHRWSQDKAPEALFAALAQLMDRGAEFEIALLGKKSGQPPAVFQWAAEMLGQRLVHMGPVEGRREYWRWLFWADVCISTALQEYQGLAVAEAAWAGCMPLVPDAFVYPQLYPDELRYGMGKLADNLAKLVAQPESARKENYRSLVEQMAWPALSGAWKTTLEELYGT